MGNQLQGFPVSRAKIADMITGTAAPSAHHTQHENGGIDEIDATGLTGAGGGGGGIGSFQSIGSTFESLSGYLITPTGSAGTTVDAWGVTLTTGATINSTAKCRKFGADAMPALSFDYAMVFFAEVAFDMITSKAGRVYLSCGDSPIGKHIGFYVDAGVLYGSNGDDSSETHTLLETLATLPYYEVRSLRAVFTPGVSVKFYVDNVLIATSTTFLPSGLPTTSNPFHASLKNQGVAEVKNLYISSWSVQIAT